MIEKNVVWQQLFDLMNPISESHEHPDKRYSFEIKFNGYTKEGYMYIYDSADQNIVFSTGEL